MPPRSTRKAVIGPGTKKKVVKPSPKISPEAPKIVEAVDLVEEVSAFTVIVIEQAKEEVITAEIIEAKAEKMPSVPALVSEREGKGCQSSITGMDNVSTIVTTSS